MTELLIEASGLHTFYGVSHILHDIDFTVGKGETIGLMGRNGMGKTTLIRSLLGLVRPREGTVRVRGEDMTRASPHAIARRGVAYVPEGPGYYSAPVVVAPGYYGGYRGGWGGGYHGWRH